MDSIKQGAGKAIEKIFSPADRSANPAIRKAARLFFCLLIIAAAGALFAFTYNTVGPASLGNPNPLKIMGFLLPIGVAGLGFSLLMKTLIPKKHHHTASKIMAFATVLFFVVGGLSFVHFAMANTNPGPMKTLILANPWLYIGGTLATAGSLYALSNAIPAACTSESSQTTVDDDEFREEILTEAALSRPQGPSIWQQIKSMPEAVKKWWRDHPPHNN